MIQWNELPECMQTDAVRPYYDLLKTHRTELAVKRAFDIAASAVLILLTAIPMGVIAIIIRCDSPGPIIFRQVRITQYAREFRIHKFRTMRSNDHTDTLSVKNDIRITGLGAFLRKYRLDELPQLLDVFAGKMTFVGTRPEIPKFVSVYTDEMYATLLIPAGITSRASLLFKDEAEFLTDAENADKVYKDTILPAKMHYNLEELRSFSLRNDFRMLIKTISSIWRP